MLSCDQNCTTSSVSSGGQNLSISCPKQHQLSRVRHLGIVTGTPVVAERDRRNIVDAQTLGRLRTLAWLSRDQLEGLAQSLESMKISRRQPIFLEGQASDRVYVLLSGVAKLSFLNRAEKELVGASRQRTTEQLIEFEHQQMIIRDGRRLIIVPHRLRDVADYEGGAAGVGSPIAPTGIIRGGQSGTSR